MKQKLTNQDIAYLVTSLNELLDGSYLVQIYDGSEKDTRTLIFKLRKKLDDESNVYYLLFESGKRVHTIDEFVSIRKNPSGCVSKLRKELGKRRLFPINQIGNDRIIDLQFSNDRHLILELYDKGNIILTDENYNIRLGSYYLKYLLKRYEGSKVLTLAAYNAGPANLKKWLSNMGDPRKKGIDPLVWIELIPYPETRNYIKRVLEAVWIYDSKISGSVEKPNLAKKYFGHRF